MAISPLVCSSYHRMAYILTDNVKYSPKKVRITPYLHEKKLFLVRQNSPAEYMYTFLN